MNNLLAHFRLSVDHFVALRAVRSVNVDDIGRFEHAVFSEVDKSGTVHLGYSLVTSHKTRSRRNFAVYRKNISVLVNIARIPFVYDHNLLAFLRLPIDLYIFSFDSAK